MTKRKLLIVAPHFGHPGHLGGVRTERFQRWASEEGLEVIVVRAAGNKHIEEKSWGWVVTVRDPLGFYREDAEDSEPTPHPPRRTNILRRTIAYLLWVPDPIMPWARRALRSSSLRTLCPEPDWVLASSPPESSLVLAARLADRSGSPLLVDFRDGWLDESMIPMLRSSAIQRRRHAGLESLVVRKARNISLSSPIWLQMLASRYPDEVSKMCFLPNNCSPDFPAPRMEPTSRTGPLKLLYAGKIHSSRPERRTQSLLDPLLTGLPPGGELIFQGNLNQREIEELVSHRNAFEKIEWKLIIRPPVTRHNLWEEIRQADGLLMLSNSRASIPAKLFDYLPSGRPIFAVTERGSILDRLKAEIPRLFLYHDDRDGNQIMAFLRACRSSSVGSIPEMFTEASARQIFLKMLAQK